MRRALITGVGGQDGLYLAELLVSKGYEVHGIIRGQNNPRWAAVRAAVPDVKLHAADLLDIPTLLRAFDNSEPQEIYNLAGISFVGHSWGNALLTSQVTGIGVLNMLEAIRCYTHDNFGGVRFYQASSSEMFGTIRGRSHGERAAFRPRSPYGVSKVFGHQITVNYRESYGLHASCGILFNHESPRRGTEFVTRKVSRAVARIALGLQDGIVMGNLDAVRDWGFAGDYVRAMWMMLQEDAADDYVICTGKAHSIRDLLAVAFGSVGIYNWSRLVRTDAAFVRPAEIDALVGDPTKARDRLGWWPVVGFEELIQMMVQFDLDEQRRIHKV